MKATLQKHWRLIYVGVIGTLLLVLSVLMYRALQPAPSAKKAALVPLKVQPKPKATPTVAQVLENGVTDADTESTLPEDKVLLMRSRCMEYLGTGDMVALPAGTYWRGSRHGVIDEKPAHRVRLRGFKMDRYEVTLGQYCAFLNTYGADTVKAGKDSGKRLFYPTRQPTGIYKDSLGNYLVAQGMEDYPAGRITWYGAREYATFFGKRLPTEAEWEYAAHAGARGDSTEFSGGDDIEAVGWYRRNSGLEPHPVGTKRPNPAGLYDMTGNLWEWCADTFHQGFYKKRQKNNPVDTEPSRFRSLRGGAYNYERRFCRVNNRYHFPPHRSRASFGFRCAK